MSTYKTLHEFGMDEIIIEKSTFIGYAKPIKTDEEAREFIEKIKNREESENIMMNAARIINREIRKQRREGREEGREEGIASQAICLLNERKES